MKTSLWALALLVLGSSASYASPATDKLSQCLVGKTTGDDRVKLVRWIFSSISQHPALTDMAQVSPQARTAGNMSMAALMQRLIAVDCVAEVRAASTSGENLNAVFESAFGTLGQVAMAEVMNDKSTKAAISEFPKYLDASAIAEAVATTKK